MRRLTLLAIIVLSGCELYAQDTLVPASGHDAWDDGISSVVTYRTTASLNAEVGGNGGIYSINFQRHIPNRFKLPVYVSVGLCVFPRGSLFTLSIPVSVNYRLNCKGANAFVFGAGQTLILSNSKGGYIRGTFRVGYRWTFLKKRAWYLEAAYTPFYSYFYNFQLDNWFGVSFGYYLNSKGS